MTIVWVQSVSCVGVITAGYNNLVNWPSSINRPSLSATTLTWTGPVGGGPSTANDTVQTQTLTAASSVVSSADGQIIENLNITGGQIFGNLVINHNNVTVRKCRILGHSAGVGFGNTVDWNGTGGLIEDCVIDGNSTQTPVTNAQNGLEPGAGPLTVRRCNFINLENHITSGVATTIIDTWFHAASGADADMVEQNAGSNGLVIQHNSFDGADSVAGLLNSAINFTNFGSTADISNEAVTGNRFVNLPHFGICDDNTQGTGSVSWSCVSNGFFSVAGGLRRDATTVSPNSDNFTMVTAFSTSGSLINGGTGQI